MARHKRRTLGVIAGLTSLLVTAPTTVGAQPAAIPPPPPPPPAPAGPAAPAPYPPPGPSPPAAPGAVAPPPSPPLSEKAEMAAADAAAHAKDWGRALAHWQAALRLAPSARAQIGLAESLYQIGRLGEAYDAFTEAQTTYGPKLGAADKTLVAARLKDLAAKTGWLSIRVAEPGANVSLDGSPLGTSPVPALIRVPAGPHIVSVTKEGFTPFETRGDVPPDGKTVVDATLVRAATTGHLTVRTQGEPLRVILDGIDVGMTPWEGEVAAGAHDVAGRSSTATAAAQPVSVVAGGVITVDLAASSLAAHFQVRTNDGQGLIVLDGVPRGQGAFAADLPPGPHTLVVSRDGFQPYEKVVTLAPQQTWAETVTLPVLAPTTSKVSGAERPIEGVYGGLGLMPVFGVGGQGTELETGCSTLGASSCNTPSAFGGSLFGYVGWTWNPVGFELFFAGDFDHTRQTASFNGMGNSGNLPLSMPARTETFDFFRGGGVGALRARALFTLVPFVRVSLAGGVGVSYNEFFMVRHAQATTGVGQDVYAPGAVGHLSPAISAEIAVHFRVTPTVAVAVGGLMIADNAGESVASPAGPPRMLASLSGTSPIPTPQYHMASGAQVLLGPFLGLQFGP